MASEAFIADGWFCVPYDGHDLSSVEIGDGTTWYPAFLDFHKGQRVAKIRVPQGMQNGLVKLRVNGHESNTFRINV